MHPSSPLRIGILGAAHVTPMALIRPARAVPQAQVVAIAARDPARALAFAKRHAIPRAHATYAGLLADPAIEAVYIPLPNSLHARWVIQALYAGKHVLCEKPMAANATEAEQMARAAADAERVLMEAFHYRYHPLAARMQAIVASGELGTIRQIETALCFPLPNPRNIRYRFDLAGGATMDAGCYAINLLRFLSGAEPTVVAARARRASPQIDRWMRADFRFADGRSGRMTCAMLSTTIFRAQAIVTGDQGVLRVTNPYLPQLFHRIEVRAADGVRREHITSDSSYIHQLRAFVRAVRVGGAVPTNAADAIANMRVIDAVYEHAGLQRRGIEANAADQR
jgi:predicted dehydrogenase